MMHCNSETIRGEGSNRSPTCFIFSLLKNSLNLVLFPFKRLLRASAPLANVGLQNSLFSLSRLSLTLFGANA